MKRAIPAILLGAGLFLGLLAAGRLGGPIPTGDDRQMETAFFAQVYSSVQASLQLRPWFNATADLLSRNPHLARYWTAGAAGRFKRPQTVSENGACRLTFPHAPNGGAGGLVIRSKVILINNGGADVEGTIFVYSDEGSPRVVATNLGAASRFDFRLLSGEALRLETDGSGPVTEGWIEVESDLELSGSATFTVLNSAGLVLSEVGIGDSEPTARSMIFVDVSGGRNTGWAVCNPNSNPAVLSVDLVDLEGRTLASKTVPLGAMEQNSEFVTTTFPEMEFDGFKGGLLVGSPDAPVALVTLKTRGVNFTSLPAAAQVPEEEQGEEQTIYFSRIGDGVFGNLVFRSAFVLMNNSEVPVAATMRLFDADGSPLALTIDSVKASQFQLLIPPLTAMELVTDGSSRPGAVGWAMLEADSPLTGGATFAITRVGSEAFVSDTGVPSSPMTTKPAIFVLEQGDASTGIALSNPNDQAVTVQLRLLRNRPGALVSTAAAQPAAFEEDLLVAETLVQLGPYGHLGVFAPQLFPEVAAVQRRDFEGRLEMEAFLTNLGEEFLAPVTGITLLTRGTLLTSLPLAEYTLNFGARTIFAPSTMLEGSHPSFCLNIRQLAGEQSLHRAVIALDRGSFDFSKAADGRSLGQLFNKTLVFLVVGNNFCAQAEERPLTLFHPLTFDGETEMEFFFTDLSNTPGGGVQFEIRSNLPYSDVLLLDYNSRLCFDAGLLQLPAGAGEIRISERYLSNTVAAGDGPGGLTATRYSSLPTTGLEGGAPRVEAVTPNRVLGGQEVVIEGSGFASLPGGNRVTVEGDSRVEAEVLDAATDQLTVRLPQRLADGALLVEGPGGTSNGYALDVAFAPQAEASFESLQAGAATGLSLNLAQHEGEIAFWKFRLTPSAGQWITEGFAPGSRLGSLTAATPGEPQETLDLIVESSDAQTLALFIVEPGEEDSDERIIISRADGTMRLTTEETPICSELPSDFSAVINFEAPIFEVPQTAATSFALDVELVAAPERAGFEATAHRIETRKMFRTQ